MCPKACQFKSYKAKAQPGHAKGEFNSNWVGEKKQQNFGYLMPREAQTMAASLTLPTHAPQFLSHKRAAF